jgi:hypothetical protein
MKRSDMIDIMVESYFNKLDLVGYGWSNRDLMAYILEKVEEQGMLPPIEAGMCQDHWISAQPEAFECFKWDSEDE